MPADHILIAIHDFNAGGTEVIAFRLAAAWLAKGRQVTVLAAAGDGTMRDRVPHGADVRILDPQVRRGALSRLRYGKPMALAARDIRPQAIFLPGNFHFGLARAFKARLPGTPVVGKISNPLLSGVTAATRPGWPVRRGLSWWTQGIDALAAMSLGLNREAAILLPGPEAGGPLIATIRDPFIDDDAAVTAREGSPGDGALLRLLAVGRLEPQKDFILAIDTVEQLRARRPVHLTIVGEGAERGRLERHIAARGLGSAVTLTGYLPAVDACYDAADLLLVSSGYEGGPAVAVEALVRGLPFAATDCSDFLRELEGAHIGVRAAAPGAAGLADAVETAAAAPFPAAAVIEAAIARNRLDRAARSWLTLIDGLVDAPRD